MSIFIRSMIAAGLAISQLCAGQWEQVWSNEFNTGSAPSSSDWGYDLGGGGWGNSELEYYTNDSRQKSNCYCSRVCFNPAGFVFHQYS